METHSGEKQNLDFNQALNFLNAVLQKSQSFTQHMDNQISILIGLSTAIFAFFASQLKNSVGQGNLPLVILTVFPLLSAVTGLFAVHPPRFMRKRNQPESLMYNKKSHRLCLGRRIRPGAGENNPQPKRSPGTIRRGNLQSFEVLLPPQKESVPSLAQHPDHRLSRQLDCFYH